MKIKTLLLTAAMAGAFQSSAATADWNGIEIKADEDKVAIIEIGGPHRDAYREVLSKNIDFYIWARGDTSAALPDNPHTFRIDARQGDEMMVTKYEGTLYEVWKKYKIKVPYWDTVLPDGYDNLAPIRRCNKLLEKTSGQAREDFLFKGGTVQVDKTYLFRGVLQPNPKVFSNLYAPVLIKCLPLDHDPQRAKLRIEPAKLEKVGKFVCPMELRLLGSVESREKFSGKSIFVGPHYLSAITDLNYTKAGNRNVSATYKIKWQKMGGLTTAPNQEPKKQDLTFRFNVSDKSGKLVETAEERVQVSCRKIKSNAPTASGDMTINPAN